MLLSCLMVFALPLAPQATGLRIENARLETTSRDAESQAVELLFDVAWSGSWRDEASWDAAWIFAKFERSAGVWADLRFDLEGHSALGETPLGLLPAEVPGGYASGLVLQRSGAGRGDLRCTVRARWSYGSSYFELPAEGAPVQVYGVELVRVPAGPFEVGEGTAAERQPNSFRLAGDEPAPYRVADEGEIDVGTEPGALTYDVPEGEAYAGGDQAGPIPAAFPKGTRAFYVMKYPLTQGQYAAYLTRLPPRARAARDVTLSPGYAEKGGSIRSGPEGCVAAFPDRAANFLTWADGIGWASWAGLRPMTELEYEKAAAGTEVGEPRYADGELPDSVASSERRSRWGAVDLRGGLWERVVSLGTAAGRAYEGSPGRGYVDDAGLPYAFANLDWPGARAVGSAYRGGTEGLLGLSEVADRTYGAYEATYGNESQGFRGVLAAPGP